MDQISYKESCDLVMQGISNMLFEIENPLGNFKKETYEKALHRYIGKHQKTLDALEAAYGETKDPSDFCVRVAEHLVNAASQRLSGIERKGKRDQRQMNDNMTLAIYVFPALTMGSKEAGEALADAIVVAWNQRFHTNVSKSTYEGINSGFQKKLCYITTAVCESLGKGDDCYELTLLRNYRDTWLVATPQGKELVEEYYNIAPTIVTRINRQENAKQIYQDIWNTYLRPCIQYIEAHQEQTCQRKYMEMVMELKGRYIA